LRILSLYSSVEPEDQSGPPNKHINVPGAGEPFPGISESTAGALFAVGRRKPPGVVWEPPTPEELQRSFSQYEIRGILGRGGMGAVYKGWQKSLERLVAIKVLPPNLDDGGMNFADRFKQEARAMAKFKHPGIVAVYDAGETPEGLLYFIMEYIEGTDVQKLVASQGRLPPAQALGIAARVCEALTYAHEHGVIHRDIKPSNVMIEIDGTVKVADFGLAKLSAPQSALLTVSRVSIGTPDFMAPEALKEMPNVDQRADIYAVGVMLYQMLTGEIPRGRFVPPSRAVPGLDKRLDGIVDRTLQTAPEARYSSAVELRSAIDPITRSLTRRIANEGAVGGSTKHPWKMGVLIGVAAVVLATVAFFIFRSESPHAGEKALPPAQAPAARWVAPYPDPSKIPDISGTEVIRNEPGWVRRKPGAPELVAIAADRSDLLLADGGMRARFDVPNVNADWPSLHIRKDRNGYLGFGCRRTAAGTREVYMEHRHGQSSTELASAPLEKAMPGNSEYHLELYAVGSLLVGRIDGQTLSVRLRPDQSHSRGTLAIWGADRTHFRDFEILPLDDVPQADALKFVK
jgi:serine/threonine protein kinase